MTEMVRIASESPVPSMTLQITKQDAQRFLEASQELMKDLKEAQEKASASMEENTHSSGAAKKDESVVAFKKEEDDDDKTVVPPITKSQKPLYLKLYEAARDCEHPSVSSYLERVAALVMPLLEIQTGFLIFHDMDKASKLRHLFQVFSSSAEAIAETDNDAGRVLNRQGALSLFRAVLVAISSCAHTPEQQNIIVEGKPETERSEEPLQKKVKREDGTETATATTKTLSEEETRAADEQGFRPCQSPSFDSSLATLRDEDDKLGLQKEIEEIAVFAADELVKYSEKEHSSAGVSLATLEAWYELAGETIVPWMELLQVSNWKTPLVQAAPTKESQDADSPHESPGSLMTEDDASRTLVSFDFSGASANNESPLCAQISEDNLFALRHLEERTALMHQPASHICKKLLHMAERRQYGSETVLTLHRNDLRQAVDSIIPTEVLRDLSKAEREAFYTSFLSFFQCFEESKASLQPGEVDVKEFAVGFCFFCAGNKSTKLAAGFELLHEKRVGGLSKDQLLRYLQCYLTMLVAVSLLTPMGKQQRSLSVERRKAIREAVRNGATWTLGHFLRSLDKNHASVRKDEYSFETFANWYSVGGYNVAPWLELLDLNKTLSLLAVNDSPIEIAPPPRAFLTTERKPPQRDRVSSLRRHHSCQRAGPHPEVLFTFPLSSHRSLIVLKEDATYVRGVVEQMGLLSMSPYELWHSLTDSVRKRRTGVKIDDGAIYVSSETFVQCVQEACPRLSRKRPAGSSIPTSSVRELLANFFQCFDLDQIDSVALDELMGGLCLLCGGKKSAKLAFAFGVFDSSVDIYCTKNKKKDRSVHLLKGEDLFLFFRSILIVTFSCCRQSLDMTDEMVGQCIADTANMICNDVMNHQFQKRQSDRLNFDDFGEWYNDGGFERAPWLELLDLKKWVLVDDFDVMKVHEPPDNSSLSRMPVDPKCPPPPPEDALDPSFFDDTGIMPMDSIDEMDMMLMQNPSTDKGDIPSPKLSNSFSLSPREAPVPERRGNPLKFQLITNEDHGGYTLSLSQTRIHHFRQVLEQSGLHGLDAETACNEILRASKTSKSGESTLTKKAFDSAMRQLLPSKKASSNAGHILSSVLDGIFDAFDYEHTGEPSAIEVACGFTVLCKGKKSDKLEFAFEVLDKKKRGQLSDGDVAKYLRCFLTVLFSIAFSSSLANDPIEDTLNTLQGRGCERSADSIGRASDKGAAWAASVAFKGFEEATQGQRSRDSEISMTFDDFADWYTTAGFRTIPWLELLDLRKWVITPETE